MRSKTRSLLESIQQNSITSVVDKVAEQFKSEIIEEYKASETKEISTELENKITKALAIEGVDSPEDWVADVCSVALDMTPTGEALAIKEAVNYNLGKDIEYLDAYEKAENYNEATNACKINAFKANIDLGEDIYVGTVKLEDGTVEQHYFNVVDNGLVRDHSNIFATGTPKEYTGINLSKIFEEKGYTPNPDGSATGPNGEKLNITITTNGIIFTIDGNQVKYEDFIKESINEDENIDIKEQLKQLGIKSIYVSDEHKRADEDELNKLGGLEYNYRLQRNPSKAHYYSYLSINHETLGDIYISFDIETNKIDTTGFPWNFIKEAMTPEIKEFVETNEEFFNNLLKSKELGTGINLNESANDNEAMVKRIKDATGYDDEYCRKIIEDGDYVWFKGVDNEEDLGKAYVDMVGMQGISDKSKYIDEEKYRDSWRELAEENIREENPDLDENEFEAEVEKWLDAVVPEQLEIAKLDGENLDKYFDYEALGRDLNFEDYYFVDDGCIGIFN